MTRIVPSVSRRGLLAGGAAIAATGNIFPASAGLPPRLLQLLEQRERLDTEIARLAALVRKLLPSVPEAIRIDPLDASMEFLDSGCASFHTANMHGEACLWGTSGWWDRSEDAERLKAAEDYTARAAPAWEALGEAAEDRIFDLSMDLGALENEILRHSPASAELRLLGQIACEQFLAGRADYGFPLRLVLNMLRLV